MDTTTIPDYYEILGVAPSSSLKEIKRAFRKRAMEIYPDRADSRERAHEDFIALHEAYTILSNTGSRAEYDQYREFAGAGFSYAKNDSNEQPGNNENDFDPTVHYDPVAGWKDWEAFTNDPRSWLDKTADLVLREKATPANWSSIMNYYGVAGRILGLIGAFIFAAMITYNVSVLSREDYNGGILVVLFLLFAGFGYGIGIIVGTVAGLAHVEIITTINQRKRRKRLRWVKQKRRKNRRRQN